MAVELRDEAPGIVRVAGTIDRREAERFVAWALVAEVPGASIELELEDAEIDGGAACAELVRGVRALLDRGLAVRLVHAPQALAHVIYRIGMMGRVTLVEPREEEPTSS